MIAKLVCNRQVATTSLFQAVSVEYTNIKTMLSRRYSIYSTGLYGYSVLQPTYDSWVAPCCTHSRRELFGAWLSLRRHVYESTGCGVQPASAAGASTSLFFETGAELKETVQVWVSLSTLNSCWGTPGGWSHGMTSKMTSFWSLVSWVAVEMNLETKMDFFQRCEEANKNPVPLLINTPEPQILCYLMDHPMSTSPLVGLHCVYGL